MLEFKRFVIKEMGVKQGILLLLFFISIGFSQDKHEYIIDTSHSSVAFAITHLSVADTIGIFEDFEGRLFLDDKKNITLVGSVKIPSINTFNNARDQHLQNSEFFSSRVATLESIRFKDNVLYANLTINGISKEIPFNVIITGPIRNPNLDKKKSVTVNPLIPQSIPDNPVFQLPDSANDNCGCYVSYGDNVVGIKLQGKINRFDFNVAHHTPKEFLGKYIDITIILEASR